jgi:hypothetical protein
LVVQKGSGHAIELRNVGDTDAFDVHAEKTSDSGAAGALQLEGEPLRRLSPGGQWSVGLYAPTMGTVGTPVLRVTWFDEAGDEYDAEFPL